MLKCVPIKLLDFCKEPRTPTEVWQFCRQHYGIYKRTPQDLAVSLFKNRYMSRFVEEKLVFEYTSRDLFFEKVRQYLVIKRKGEKKAVPRKLLSIYQTNILYPLTLYFHYSSFPSELKEINFDLSILFKKIFAQGLYITKFLEVLNLILCYSEDRDRTRLLIYDILDEEKADLVDKFLYMCKKIPKELSIPFNGNVIKAQRLLEELVE